VALCVVAACSPAPGGSGAGSASGPATPTGSSASQAPGPADAGSVRFSVLGDIDSTEDSAAVLDGIAARGDDLALAVGDLSYGQPGEEQAWCRFVTDRVGSGYPFEVVAGNHEDDDGPNGSIDAFRECLPNRLPGLVGDYGRQWYADVPAGQPLVRVVLISPGLLLDGSTWSYAEGTPRYDWTRDAVRGARDAGIPWVVVGMHLPCLTVGVYECASGVDVVDLLVREGVDLVVTGHEHMYQRTAPLALGAGCTGLVPGRYDAACVAGRGTTFITVGTGGRSLRDADPEDAEWPYFRAVSARNLDPAHGSLAVEATADRLVARFEPVAGATFTDTVTMTR
jgi:hypothetical protein